MSASILCCTAADPRPGATHYFSAAFWLQSQGYSVRVACTGRTTDDRQVRSPLGSLPAHFLQGNQAKFQWTLLRQILSFHHTAAAPRLLYVMGHYCSPAAYLATIVCPGIKVIYHTQDYIEPGRHRHWEFFERRLARKAQGVISNEPNRARFMASNYQLKQLPAVVPTLLPKDWPTPEFDQELRNRLIARSGGPAGKDHRLVMHFGGYAPVRCGRQMIEAFAQLPVEYLLVLTSMPAGSSSETEANALIRKLNLQHRIVMLGRLEFGEMMAYAACCDLGLLLYPNDGVGNFYQAPGRLTEYIKCGLPVVSSNFPGLELLTLKYNLGAVCDPESPQSIAEAIRRIGGQDRSEFTERRRVLRLLAQTDLTYEANAWRIGEMVRKVCGLAE